MRAATAAHGKRGGRWSRAKFWFGNTADGPRTGCYAPALLALRSALLECGGCLGTEDVGEIEKQLDNCAARAADIEAWQQVLTDDHFFLHLKIYSGL